VDVVSGFFDHTIQMAAQGRPLVAFVSMLRFPGLALVVSPAAGRRVESVKDLAGGNVGVSAPGSSTHFLLNHLLIQAGLKAEQVSAIGVGMTAAAVAAMENGKVDAAIMAEPAISQLEQRKGPMRVLADTRTVEGVRAVYGTDTYPAAVLYSSKEWVEKNEIIAQRLARAIRRTLEWMAVHTAAEIAAKMPENFRGQDEALYARAIDRAKPMYSADGKFDPEAAKAVARNMSESLPALREQPVDATSCFTNRLLP
jgi:NitT/TauT family transport system substrate-binding protein